MNTPLSRSHPLVLASFILIASGFVGCVPREASPVPAAVTWSNPKVASLNPAFAGVHGLFHAEPVAVTLRALPPHGWVRVRFKVVATGSWDGSFLPWGPDLWTMQVRGGQQLMCTSFSSMGARSANYVQAFPDDYPWGLHYAFTGGSPVNGKPFERPGCAGCAIADAVYPVEVWFPHRGDELTLDFAGVFPDPPQEKQCWGIADFEYATTPEPVGMDAAELDRLWVELAAPQSLRANAAMWKLISGGDAAARFIAAKADALPAAPPGQYLQPEGMRMRRVQKILRIIRTPGTIASGSELTYRLPEMSIPTPATTE